jgi:hypothetical protein
LWKKPRKTWNWYLPSVPSRAKLAKGSAAAGMMYHKIFHQ